LLRLFASVSAETGALNASAALPPFFGTKAFGFAHFKTVGFCPTTCKGKFFPLDPYLGLIVYSLSYLYSGLLRLFASVSAETGALDASTALPTFFGSWAFGFAHFKTVGLCPTTCKGK